MLLKEGEEFVKLVGTLHDNMSQENCLGYLGPSLAIRQYISTKELCLKRDSNSLTFETRENDNRSARDAGVEPGKVGNGRLSPISLSKRFFGSSRVVAKTRMRGMMSSIIVELGRGVFRDCRSETCG